MEYITLIAAIGGIYLGVFGLLVAVAFGLAILGLLKGGPYIAVSVLLLSVALLLLAFGK